MMARTNRRGNVIQRRGPDLFKKWDRAKSRLAPNQAGYGETEDFDYNHFQREGKPQFGGTVIRRNRCSERKR